MALGGAYTAGKTIRVAYTIEPYAGATSALSDISCELVDPDGQITDLTSNVVAAGDNTYFVDIRTTGPEGDWWVRFESGEPSVIDAWEIDYQILTSRVTATVVLPPVTDHDALAGLGDDDHPQYLLRSDYDLIFGADYIVQPTSTGYTARSMTGGTSFTHVTDAGNVTQSAITELGTDGGVIILRGALAWGSVPSIPPGITNKLWIVGAGCTVTLSTAGPRFLDLGRTADHDTFRNIEVTDFLIDCDNIGGAAGQTHAIIGDSQNIPTSDQRVNIENVTVRRIRAINIPSDTAAGTPRRGISFGCRHLGDAEATENWLRDILIEDVVLEGGIYGFSATGGSEGAYTNLSVTVDNVRIIRCKHLQPAQVTPAVAFGASIHIGSVAPVGYCLIRDFFCEYSSDVGVEVNNAVHVDMEDVTVYNADTPFFLMNYSSVPISDRQQYTLRRCRVIHDEGHLTNDALGFVAIGDTAQPFGSVTYDGCVYENTGNKIGTGSVYGPIAFFFRSDDVSGVINRVTIRDCKVTIENIAYNNAANSDLLRAVRVYNAAVRKLIVRNLDVRFTGAASGAGAVACRVLGLDNPNVIVDFDIDGVDIDWDITGQPAAINQNVAFFFGGSTPPVVQGTIRNVRCANLSNNTDAIPFRMLGTANLTIGANRILIENCDLAASNYARAIDIDATQTALGAVIARSNRYNIRPVPVALTGLTTATGKLLGAQAQTVFWRSLVQCVQGTGTAITAIDYSTNGGTTYTNLLTQASGALPAGLGPQVGPLLPADLIRVTFTGTQPTITLVPVDP